MSRTLAPETVEALTEDIFYPFFAIEMFFPPVLPPLPDPWDGEVRLWTGGSQLTDAAGNIWIGSGNVLSISAVEETSKMDVRGATVTLGGVTGDILSLALTQAYQGRKANIYFGNARVIDEYLLWNVEPDDDTTFITQIDLDSLFIVDTTIVGFYFNQIFSGYMDQLNIDEAADGCTVELRLENKLVDLERSRVARYTDSWQQDKYLSRTTPVTDLGLEFVESLQDKKITWGRTPG